MRIAIIGTGIAGNAVSWALKTGSDHEIVVYERQARAGGHSATVDIDYEGKKISVDTGFIVYNELNYANFTQLLKHLDVETQESNMSFSVSFAGGAFEWSGQPSKVLNGLFAQRRNIVSPRHFRMIGDMWKFNRRASLDLHAGHLHGLTLKEYLDRHDYAARFREDYLIPMGAAIWSMSEASVLDFPAESFVAFFENHRLMHWNRPVWKTIKGGSREYVSRLVEPFKNDLRLGQGATRVERFDDRVIVHDVTGAQEVFDQVVMACHTNETLALLDQTSAEERAVLEAIPYASNDVYLHRDESLMPRRKAAWASWNVLREEGHDGPVAVTYWMNLLQNIDHARPLFVSLNPPRKPQEDTIFGSFSYDHPQYTKAGLAAQSQLVSLQGKNRTWFCGAWTRYGFHEDGLSSGLGVAQALGASIPWRKAEHRLVEAAE